MVSDGMQPCVRARAVKEECMGEGLDTDIKNVYACLLAPKTLVNWAGNEGMIRGDDRTPNGLFHRHSVAKQGLTADVKLFAQQGCVVTEAITIRLKQLC